MSRRILLTLSVVSMTAFAVSPALAAKTKTISGSYQATTTAADPTPFVTSLAGTGGACEPNLEQAMHEKEISLPAAGTWKVELNGFQGDWALAVLNSKGQVLQAQDQDVTQPIDTPHKITQKIKTKGTYTIRACNFSGGLTANVKWSFTYTVK